MLGERASVGEEALDAPVSRPAGETLVKSTFCSEPNGFMTDQVFLLTTLRLGWGPRHLFADTKLDEFTWIPLAEIANARGSGLVPAKLRVTLHNGQCIELAMEDARDVARALQPLLGLR